MLTVVFLLDRFNIDIKQTYVLVSIYFKYLMIDRKENPIFKQKTFYSPYSFHKTGLDLQILSVGRRVQTNQ